MGKIAVLEYDTKAGTFQEVIDGFETTDEALKWLRFNGQDGTTYQTAQLGRLVKCKKVTTMQLNEVKKEVKKDG